MLRMKVQKIDLAGLTYVRIWVLLLLEFSLSGS